MRAIDDWVFCFVTCELYFVFITCALTLFLDSAFVARGRGTHPLPFQSISIAYFDSHIVHDLGEYPLIFSQIATSASFYQQRPDFRDLEGCYGFYRTFPISNLTPEPDPVFHRPHFPKQGVTLRVFLSYFIYLLKIKQKQVVTPSHLS